MLGEEDNFLSVEVNMVILIPSEFWAYAKQSNKLDGDVFVEDVECASLIIDPNQQGKAMIFEKPIEEMGRHLKPLYIRAHINDKTLSRVIVDGGVVLNVILINTMKKIGKGVEDLTTNMKMIKFTCGGTYAWRVLVVDITVGTKTKKIVLFVVDAKPAYTLLLGRDWIHRSKCVTSTIH